MMDYFQLVVEFLNGLNISGLILTNDYIPQVGDGLPDVDDMQYPALYILHAENSVDDQQLSAITKFWIRIQLVLLISVASIYAYRCIRRWKPIAGGVVGTFKDDLCLFLFIIFPISVSQILFRILNLY